MHSDEHRALAGLCKSSTERFVVQLTVVVSQLVTMLCAPFPQKQT